MNKWDYMQLKSFCTAKEPISKVKDSLWNRKIFANYVSDKGLIPQYIKNSNNLIAKNNPT